MPQIQINDTELYYEEKGSGEPLFLISRLGMSLADWSAYVEAFSKNHRVVCMDYRGTGRSAAYDGPYSKELLASDVVQLMRALGEERFSVIGISLGSHLAFELAINYPHAINKAVMGLAPDRISEHGRARLRHWIELRQKGLDREFSESVFLWIFGEDFWADKLRSKEWLEWATPPYSTQTYIKLAELAAAFDVSDRTSSIKCPCLVVAGKRDIIFSADQLKAAASRIPRSEFKMIDSAHALIDGAVNEFISISSDFLGR